LQIIAPVQLDSETRKTNRHHFFRFCFSNSSDNRPEKPAESVNVGNISSAAAVVKDDTSNSTSAPPTAVETDPAVSTSPVALQPATTPQPALQPQPQDIHQHPVQPPQQIQQPQPQPLQQAPVSPLTQQVVLFLIQDLIQGLSGNYPAILNISRTGCLALMYLGS